MRPFQFFLHKTNSFYLLMLKTLNIADPARFRIYPEWARHWRHLYWNSLFGFLNTCEHKHVMHTSLCVHCKLSTKKCLYVLKYYVWKFGYLFLNLDHDLNPTSIIIYIARTVIDQLKLRRNNYKIVATK